MKQCPKCGMYMYSFIKHCFGGWYEVWSCTCGYSSEDCKSSVSNTTDWKRSYIEDKRRCCGSCKYYNGKIGDEEQFCDELGSYVHGAVY